MSRLRSGVRLLAAVCAGLLAISASAAPSLGAGGHVRADGLAPKSPGDVFASGDEPGLVITASLVVPRMQWLVANAQLRDAQRASRESAQSFVRRWRSQTEFAHLDASRAARLALESFPVAIGQRAGGTPALPPGAHLDKYVSTRAAALSLPHHRHGVLESIQPIATAISPHRFAPIDLGLKPSVAGYAPVTPLVGVEIPSRLSAGVSLPSASISLVPVEAGGRPLQGSPGALDGASVLYANTQTDADTVAQPTTSGFELSTILRSIASPRTLYYRVRAPGGVRLRQTAAGRVAILSHGVAAASVMAPSAADASGLAVPVSMSVAGDLLVVSLGHSREELQWPVRVDPAVNDEALSGYCDKGGWAESCKELHNEGQTNWQFVNPRGVFAHTECYCEGHGWIRWYPNANYVGGDSAGVSYVTQGESEIDGIEITTKGSYSNNAAVSLEVLTHGGEVTSRRVLEHPESQEAGNCARNYAGHPCQPGEGTPENMAQVITAATTSSGGPNAFSTELTKASVYIYQKNPPKVSFNTTDPQIAIAHNRTNVLYSKNETWLGPYAGALEVVAEDPGIGVGRAEVSGYEGRWIGGRDIYFRGECKGVQCKQNYKGAVTYVKVYSGAPPRMVNGEFEVLFTAENQTGARAEVKHVLKVDASPPHNLAVSGWPTNREISAAPHTVTVEATDGEKVKSSGVKSISVKVDGGAPTTVAGAECAPGPCTASGKYTIAAEALSEGLHRLVVTATDNANNVAADKFTFDVRHAAPLPVGPGAVDPTTGQFALHATDVSLGGITGVSRVYQSRNLTAGVDGPLGSQWAISLGASQKLTVLPDGSVALSAVNGGRTTFVSKGEGKFESPLGNSNLSVEAKEAVPGQGITEYLVKDTTAGSTTHFTQPSGTEKTAPSFANQFGNEGAQLNGPSGVAVDSGGNTWVVDSMDDRVMKFSPDGVLVTAYGKQGSGAGQLLQPSAIAIDPSSGSVYVADEGNHRVVALNPLGEFQRAFGWGVRNGAEEFQICRTECQTGLSGAGNGEFASPQGIAVDSSGNVWVTDAATNRIQEFNSNGEFVHTYGREGTGEVQFKQPQGIAFSQGKLYVAERGNDRVQELSTAGKFEGQFGKEGAGNREFKEPDGIAADPRSGDLYVADKGNGRVQEFTPAGALIAKFGTSGSGSGQFTTPAGVGVSGSGAIYVSDYGANRVDEWMRSAWLPTVSEGTLSSGTSTRSYAAVEVEEGNTGLFPTEVPAPTPVGVSCGTKPEELKKGCRALLFKYASRSEKSASGEGPGEWGTYPGRLLTVAFMAYNPATGKMEEKPVAEYAYDGQGRLRAERDPRIEPALKTRYGYDKAGHVVAVSRAGQEPWLIQYGALGSDPDPGRLLSVTRPAAGKLSAVEEEARMPAPTNEEAPKLASTSPQVGVTLSVSHGKWHNNPLTYGYQWFSCASENGKWEEALVRCGPIAGAVNSQYTPLAGDRGHHLYVAVTATNADGSTVSCTAQSCNGFFATEAVTGSSELSQEPVPPPPSVGSSSVLTVEYGLPLSGSGLPTMTKEELANWGQTNDLPAEGAATAIFPPDKPMGWPAASYDRATITYLDEQGRAVNVKTPDGGIATSEYNEANEVVRTLSAQNRATSVESGGSTEAKANLAHQLDTKSQYVGNGELSETLGPEHAVKLAHGEHPGEGVPARAHVVYSYDEKGLGLVTKTEDSAKTTSGKEFDKRTTVTSYDGQGGLGWTLRKPTSVTVDPGGMALTTTTRYDSASGNVTETIPPGNAGALLPVFEKPFGKAGSGAGEVSSPSAIAVDAQGNVWVTDTGNDRLDEFSAQGTFVKAVGWGVAGGKRLEVCTVSCRAGVTGRGKTALSVLLGITYDAAAEALFVSDAGKNQIVEFSTEGAFIKSYPSKGKLKFSSPRGLFAEPNGNIWIASQGSHRLVEMTDRGKYVTAAGVGKGEFSDVTVCYGKLYAADAAGQQIDEVGTASSESILRSFGKPGKENGQFTQLSRIACNPQNGDIYASDSGADKVDVFTGAGKFVGAFGAAGTQAGDMNAPIGVAVVGSGATYVVDSANNRLLAWSPGTGATTTHGARTAYYTAEAESPVPACRYHAEWADLPCQSEPLAQPETPGLPALPVISYRYNLWDEVEATIEKFPASGKFHAVTREKLQTYDAAGRALTSEVRSEPATGASLPAVTNSYNGATGTLEKQSASGKAITSTYNTVGQLEKYTDAGGSTTTYEYEPGGDARLGGVEDSKGRQAYTYNTTSGALERVTDPAAGVFTASYNLGGKIRVEEYPNGLHVSYTYNEVGKATGIEYRKLSHCEHTCPETWFADTVAPSIHGEALEQTSTLSKESYAYDNAGRLLETQEKPSSKPCTARLYEYDDESNRTSLTTRESSGSTCAGEGGTAQSHTYDSANRLTDPAVVYEELGNTTNLPEADAGGHALTTSYYVDGQVATQTQNKQTLRYQYDPAGRTEATVSEGKSGGTTVSHYGGAGEAISWTAEAAEAWTRDIPGIDGSLSGTATSSGTVTLLLHDLQGNVVATAADNEQETKLLTTYNSTEFGAPSEGKAPPKYAWLGAGGVTTEPAFESGVATKHGASYVPQIGRSLQTAPIAPPGACPDGCGSYSPYEATITAAQLASAEAAGKQLFAEAEAARQAAERRKAEEEAAAAPQPPGEVPAPGEGGPGGEIYDPEGLASYNRTEQRAQQLRHDATNTKLIAFACSFIPDIGALCGAGGELLVQALEASAEILEACVTTGREGRGLEWKYGVCFINETRASFLFFSIPIWAEAENCTWERKGRKGNEYNCLESGRKHVRGPWFK